MSNYQKLYWLTRLDIVQGLAVGLILLSVVALIIYFITYSSQSSYLDDDEVKEFEKKFGIYKKASFIIIVACSLITLFVPSKDDMILIWAGGKTMNFIQQDSSLNKIPAQATQVMYQYLDKQLKELKEEDKK